MRLHLYNAYDQEHPHWRSAIAVLYEMFAPRSGSFEEAPYPFEDYVKMIMKRPFKRLFVVTMHIPVSRHVPAFGMPIGAIWTNNEGDLGRRMLPQYESKEFTGAAEAVMMGIIDRRG